jgi:hypothetical protein
VPTSAFWNFPILSSWALFALANTLRFLWFDAIYAFMVASPAALAGARALGLALNGLIVAQLLQGKVWGAGEITEQGGGQVNNTYYLARCDVLRFRNMIQNAEQSTLVALTKSVCADIEQKLEVPLRAQTLAFPDAEALWDAQYRPRAVALSKALHPFVSRRELDEQVIVEDGARRTTISTGLGVLDRALFSRELAPEQLTEVRGILERLVSTISQRS